MNIDIDFNRKLVRHQRRNLFKNLNHEDISIDVYFTVCIESCPAFKIITNRVESLSPHPLSADKRNP
jgi:hypothetical protein